MSSAHFNESTAATARAAAAKAIHEMSLRAVKADDVAGCLEVLEKINQDLDGSKIRAS